MAPQSNIILFERDRAISIPGSDLAARLWHEAFDTPMMRPVVRTLRGMIDTAAGRGASHSLHDIDGWSHHAQAAYCEERRTSRV